MSEFTGKVAIVTGAMGGIGSKLVSRLAAEGFSVVATDVDREAGEKLVAELGKTVFFKTLDVASDSDWAETISFVTAKFGGLDLLANCAGFFKPHVSFEDTSIELWRQHFAINSDGAFLGAKHAASAMKKRGGGSIVNISSGLAHKLITGGTAYCASKAALLTVTKLAALNLAQYKIRVNAILPGAIETPMLYRNLQPGQTPEQLVAMFAAQHPIGRIGTPDDIAEMILFLSSDRSSFVTGAEIAIDGGQTL